jgi:hypothetical protein
MRVEAFSFALLTSDTYHQREEWYTAVSSKLTRSWRATRMFINLWLIHVVRSLIDGTLRRTGASHIHIPGCDNSRGLQALLKAMTIERLPIWEVSDWIYERFQLGTLNC